MYQVFVWVVLQREIDEIINGKLSVIFNELAEKLIKKWINYTHGESLFEETLVDAIFETALISLKARILWSLLNFYKVWGQQTYSRGELIP